MTNLISSNGIYPRQFLTSSTNTAPLGLGGTQPIYATAPISAPTDSVSISSSASTTSSACTDGKDDGKLSLWEKIKSGVGGAVKGLVKGVVDTVTDPKKLLVAAGCVALSIVCPPAGVALAVAGGVMGAVQVGKGVIKASNATTDAEAKAAYEDIGSGTMQVGLSVVGAKAGLKSCGSTTEALAAESEGGISGALSKAKDVGAAFKEDAVTSLKTNTKLGANIADSSETGVLAQVKDGVKQTWDDSALGKNIEANGKIKGTVQTAQDKIADLKQSGADAVGRDVVDAKGSLSQKLNDLEESGTKPTVASTSKNDLIADLKSSPLDSKDSLTSYLDKVKKSDALSSTEKSEISSLAKQSYKASAKMEKINTKTDLKQSKLEDKLLNKADKATEAKKAELDSKVEKGEMTQADADKEYSDFQETKLNEIASKQVSTQASAVKGAKTQVTDWADSTIKSNADAAATKAGIDPKSVNAESIETAKTEINAKNTEIAELKKDISDLKKSVQKGGDDAETAKSLLETRQNDLKLKNGELADLQSNLSVQKNVYNADQLANGSATAAQKASALSGSVLPTVANSVKGDNSDNVETAPAATQAPAAATTQQPSSADLTTLSANYKKQFIDTQNYAAYVPGITYNA